MRNYSRMSKYAYGGKVRKMQDGGVTDPPGTDPRTDPRYAEYMRLGQKFPKLFGNSNTVTRQDYQNYLDATSPTGTFNFDEVNPYFRGTPSASQERAQMFKDNPLMESLTIGDMLLDNRANYPDETFDPNWQGDIMGVPYSATFRDPPKVDDLERVDPRSLIMGTPPKMGMPSLQKVSIGSQEPEVRDFGKSPKQTFRSNSYSPFMKGTLGGGMKTKKRYRKNGGRLGMSDEDIMNLM